MSAEDEGPAESTRSELPRAWSFEARGERVVFNMASTRPWNWIEFDREEAATMWRILKEFVAFLNRRYVERAEQTIPPCWAEHGALVEELTTLFWARWHAFETEDATVGGAQFWHNHSMPQFLERMPRWLGPDRLHKCQAGKHAECLLEEPPLEWENKTAAIGNLDILERPEAPASDDATARSTRKSERIAPAYSNHQRQRAKTKDAEPEGEGEGEA